MDSRIHQFLPECIAINYQSALGHFYQSATNNTRTSRTSFFAKVRMSVRCSSYQVKLVWVDIWQMNVHVFPQISASDPDLGPSGTVRFSLVPDSNDHYKSFTIDPLNGTIYTTARFDREELSLYKITVRATDQPTSGQAR